MSLGNFYISAAINTSVIVFKEPVNALLHSRTGPYCALCTTHSPRIQQSLSKSALKRGSSLKSLCHIPCALSAPVNFRCFDAPAPSPEV